METSYGRSCTTCPETSGRSGEKNSDMSGSLDRNRIMRLFETLSARLAARGIRGQLYIVGGRAMIVGYGRERTTRDVDARIEYAKDEVLAAAEEIAAEENLDPNWLNENARLFMPPAKDDRARTVQHARPRALSGRLNHAAGARAQQKVARGDVAPSRLCRIPAQTRRRSESRRLRATPSRPPASRLPREQHPPARAVPCCCGSAYSDPKVSTTEQPAPHSSSARAIQRRDTRHARHRQHQSHHLRLPGDLVLWRKCDTCWTP